MIVTRSPLRITLGGGGTDLPSYYEKFGGFLIAVAIDKYVYINLYENFTDEIFIKYSKLERVKRVEDIQHPIIRESIKLVGLPKKNIELTSTADIPAGTGLGSSGSFTTALLKTLHTFKKDLIHPQELAEQACYIEIGVLKETVGKQDQYISAYGGLTCFEFGKDGRVQAWPLQVDTETLYNLEDNLVLFFTGYSRSASSILKDQDVRSRSDDAELIRNMHFVKELGLRSKEALERGDLHTFADLMNVHWEYKKRRSPNMSNKNIDRWYDIARENGAIGGKVIGAGGGGFLMFYAENKTKLRAAMFAEGLREVRFRFDFTGTHVVTQS